MNKNIKNLLCLTLSTMLVFPVMTGCGTKVQNESNSLTETVTDSESENISEEPIEQEFEVRLDVLNEKILNPDFELNINNGTEQYQFITNENIKLLSFYNVSMGENNLSYIKEANIEKYENVSPESTFVLSYDVPEVMSNVGMQIIKEDGTVYNYILGYNGRDGGISLMPYSFDINKIDNSTMLEFKSLQTYAMDINNDGEKEKVLFNPEFNRETGYYELVFIVDEKEYRDDFLYTFKEPTSFAICNFNDKPIVVLNVRQENDWTLTYFYTYDNNKLTPILNEEGLEGIQGVPGETLFIEDGIISTSERIDCLATTEIKTQYKITEDNSKIEKIIPSDKIYTYETYKDKTLKVLKEIKVNKEMSKDSEEVTLKEGTTFTSNKTDGDNWSNVILETGEEYWIYFDATDLELYESIEGLIFAG